MTLVQQHGKPLPGSWDGSRRKGALMHKAWWRRLLDEGTIPALALAFAVSQDPRGGMHPQDRSFRPPTQAAVELTAPAPRVPLRPAAGSAHAVYGPALVNALTTFGLAGKNAAAVP